MENSILVITSSLLSGLIGVIVTNIIYKKNEQRKYKLSIVNQLLANRHDLSSSKFLEALNCIFVNFYNSPRVISALKAFHADSINPHKYTPQSNERLLELFKALCEEMNINPKGLSDNFFLTPFNVNT